MVRDPFGVVVYHEPLFLVGLVFGDQVREVKELYRTAPEIDELVQSILLRVEAAPRDFDQALAQFKDGKISREVFERKIVEYFNSDPKKIAIKLIEFDSAFFDKSGVLLNKLIDSGSIDLLNALVETKGMNLPQDQLDQLAWDLTQRGPDEALEKLGQLPLSEERKKQCLFYCHSHCSEENRGRAIHAYAAEAFAVSDLTKSKELAIYLIHTNPADLLPLLASGETFELNAQELERLIWELTLRVPDEVLEKIDLLPLSKEAKEACLLHILSTCKESDRAALLARLKQEGYKSVEVKKRKLSLEEQGRILGEGICSAVVRGCIEKIISGKEMPESYARFVQAVHMHSSVRLPARIEAKFKSKRVDILKVNGFSDFKDLLNNLATRRQQFSIILRNPAAESGHALHLSLEDPPGYGFADPNDFVAEVHQPTFHRFESRDEAIKAFELFVAEQYPGWQIAFLERYE